MSKILNRMNQLKIIGRDLWINSFGGSYWVPKFLRKKIYQIAGIITYSGNINPKCYFSSNKVKIGNDCYVNYFCYFDASDFITIADGTHIAMQCSFITSSHEIGGEERRAGSNTVAPIYIGKGMWIGANVTILPGVTIGDGCIIAAGAVVNKNCEENSLYAGVPAVKVKTLAS